MTLTPRPMTRNFFFRHRSKPDSDHELALLRGLLTPGVTWLDVACGTGYFLRHFPEVERAGVDLSPAMLRLAREATGDPSDPMRLPRPQCERAWPLGPGVMHVVRVRLGRLGRGHPAPD